MRNQKWAMAVRTFSYMKKLENVKRCSFISETINPVMFIFFSKKTALVLIEKRF